MGLKQNHPLFTQYHNYLQLHVNTGHLLLMESHINLTESKLTFNYQSRECLSHDGQLMKKCLAARFQLMTGGST